MNLRQMIDRFRREVSDEEKPYLWTDDEVTDYANDAVDEACRRAMLLVDSSSSVTEIPISIGDHTLELDESIIYVRRARLSSASHPLVPIVSRTMDEREPGWEDARTSTPRIFVPDWETGKIRIYPPAAAADTLKLTVARAPTADEELSSDGDTPVIPRRYHTSLLDWVKHRAYLKPDADTFNPDKAQKFADSFAGEFGPPSAAIDEHWAAEQYYDVGEF